MKINELSHITGVNPETIRSYRLKGFLHPAQLPNGYYDYSIADYVSLFYLRKMRSYNFSLDAIDALYRSDDAHALLSLLDQKADALKREIADLENRLRFLEFEHRHIEESVSVDDPVVLQFQSIDDKIDFYDFSHHDLTNMYRSTTPTLRIRKEILNGPLSSRMIPMQAGLGTYRYLLKEQHLSIPTPHVVVPNGICLSQILVTSDLTMISLQKLAPIMRYAKKNGHVFMSDTTGYLMRIVLQNNTPLFYFRIRACIEPNDIAASKTK